MEMQSHQNIVEIKNEEFNVQQLKYILVHKDQIIENYVGKINLQQEEIQSLTKQLQKISLEIQQNKFQNINQSRRIQNVKLLIQNNFVQIQQNHRYILVQIEKDAHQIQLSCNLKIVKKQFIKKNDVQIQNMKLYCQKVLQQVESVKQLAKNIDLKKEQQTKKQNQLKMKEERIVKMIQQYQRKKMQCTIDEVQTDNIMKQQVKVLAHEQIQTDSFVGTKQPFKQFQEIKIPLQEHGFQTEKLNVKQFSIGTEPFQNKQNEIKLNSTHKDPQNWSEDQQISSKKQSLQQVDRQPLKKNVQEYSKIIQPQKTRSITFSNEDVIYQIDKENEAFQNQKIKLEQSKQSQNSKRKEAIKKKSSIQEFSKKSTQKIQIQKSIQENNLVKQNHINNFGNHQKKNNVNSQQPDEKNMSNFVDQMLHINDSKEITKRLLSSKGSELQVPLASNVSIMSQASQSNSNLNFLDTKKTYEHITFEDKIKILDSSTPTPTPLVLQKKPEPLKWQSLLKLPTQKKEGDSNKKKPKTIYIRR